MSGGMRRRDFLKAAGIGTVVYAVGLPGFLEAQEKGVASGDFFFVQLSDTHWGFRDEKVNPDWPGTLKKAVAAVNAMDPAPDFVVFTGDLTHTTDDPKERRKRLSEFKEIAGGLKVKTVRFLAGEHDASLDKGEAFRELVGETRWFFDHKGVRFVALDNVSDPAAIVGDEQVRWLADTLKPLEKTAPVVVLTHRPLFDLYPQWDWATRDASKVVAVLSPYRNVTVLYGHIHQENHHVADGVAQHAAMGLMYPLPAPGSVPKKAPVPWDPASPYKGLGYRGVKERSGSPEPALAEYPVRG